MSPGSHLMLSWLASNAINVGVRERALITFAGLSPDVNGLGLLIDICTKGGDNPTHYWGEWHHSLHTLLFSFSVAIVVFSLASKRRLTTALIAFGAFQVHLICDLIGGRGPDGYQWPIGYLRPFFDTPELAWSGQWELNAWQNIAISVLTLFAVCYVSLRNQRTPFEVGSAKMNLACLDLLRKLKAIMSCLVFW